mmetsp:Transcript_130581/g.325824  ORF Transcript_130581/g.325824 Transcript_130581/m.325824 type:complete len:117 (+) Transcript_130581:96-446(+)
MPFPGPCMLHLRLPILFSTWASLLCLRPHVLRGLGQECAHAAWTNRAEAVSIPTSHNYCTICLTASSHRPTEARFYPHVSSSLSSSAKGQFGNIGTIISLHGVGGQIREHVRAASR